MKQKIFSLLSLTLICFVLISTFSCEDSDNSDDPARIKEFLTRISQDRTVVDQEIILSDLSLGVESRLWSFEGGTPISSTEPEVAVSFSDVGFKNCSLTVMYFDGTEETENFTIEVLPPLIANFENSSVEVNLPVQFTDTSEGNPDQWSWVFPNGTPETSTDPNPVVTWSAEQEVTVSLTVTRSSDGISTTEERTLSVGPPNLFSRDYHGFESPDAPSAWQTWDGGGPFPPNTITRVSGGANGTAYTGRVEYNGAGYWGMITRDSRFANTTIQQGGTYRLSFYIKAQTATSIPFVRFANLIPAWWSDELANGDPAQDFYSQGIYGIAVTTEWQKFEAEFTINDLPYPEGLNTFPDIELQGGVSPNVFFIDEISLQKLN
jgi:PKD repeat protein